MHDLAPCPGCARHLKLESVRCPFCDTPVHGLAPLGFDAELAPARVRYAALALGASLALTGCPSAALYGGPPVPPPTVDAGTREPSVAPAYGLPPDPQLPPTPPPTPDASVPRPPPTPAPAYGLPPNWRPPPSPPPAAPPRPAPRPNPPRRDDPGAPVPLYGVPPGE
ncbi:MAG: hypothetical protein U0325_02915 [Polyangiales bacterium]